MMKKRNSGAALIIVMCVMLIVLALSLALLRTAVVLVQAPMRDNQREQCRINAVSVSEVVTEEIESFLYNDEISETEKVSEDPAEDLKIWLATAAAGKWEAGARTRCQLRTDQLPGETWLIFYVKEEGLETVLYMEVGSRVGKESCMVVNRFVPVVHANEDSLENDEMDSEDMGPEESGGDLNGEEWKDDWFDDNGLIAEGTEENTWNWKFLGRCWGKEKFR